MMYRAACEWRDLEDGHLYQTGEAFPYDGRAVSPDRIESLVTGQNKARRPLIVLDNQSINDETKTRRTPKKQPKNAK